jgi:hypothetical protein
MNNETRGISIPPTLPTPNAPGVGDVQPSDNTNNVNAVDTPTAPEDSANDAAMQRFTARHVGLNEFRIFRGEFPMGRILSPVEAAIVLGWLQTLEQ